MPIVLLWLSRLLRLGLMLRIAAFVVALLATTVLFLVLLVMVLSRPQRAEASELHAPSPSTPILLVGESAQAPFASSARGVYYRRTVVLPERDARCVARLQGDLVGLASFVVDDALTLRGGAEDARPPHAEALFRHDFRDLDPRVDVRPLLPTLLPQLDGRIRTLTVVLEDLAPPTFHTSALYLVPCANAHELQAPAAAPVGPVATRPLGPRLRAAPASPAPAGGAQATLPWALLLTAAGLVVVVAGAAAWLSRRRRPSSATIWVRVDDPAAMDQFEAAFPADALPLWVTAEPLGLVPDGSDAEPPPGSFARIDAARGRPIVSSLPGVSAIPLEES